MRQEVGQRVLRVPVDVFGKVGEDPAFQRRIVESRFQVDLDPDVMKIGFAQMRRGGQDHRAAHPEMGEQHLPEIPVDRTVAVKEGQRDVFERKPLHFGAEGGRGNERYQRRGQGRYGVPDAARDRIARPVRTGQGIGDKASQYKIV